VEKLKRANIKLREKNKEAGRSAHPAAAARIAELEDQVAQLKKGTAPTTPAKRGRKPSATPAKRGRRAATNSNGATEDQASDE
jgi:predicted Zn-dependent protease